MALLPLEVNWHITDGGAVLQDGFKEFIKDKLVTAAKRIVE